MFRKIETNLKRKLFLHETENLSFSPIRSLLENQIINIEPDFHFQSLLGFGGAFTQSTGAVLSLVHEEMRHQILENYFSKNGLNYSLARLPIGSCDFSPESYSYSYQNDLADFTIEKDEKYILPFVKSALQIRNEKITFLASPWSPPAFMKDHKDLYHGGKLLDSYKKTWAQYLVKFVKSYAEEGISIDFMTIQNEPNASQPWESCRYNASEEADLLKNYLFPSFQKNRLKTKFLIWDHNKDAILQRATDCLVRNGALDFAAGIAFHWYTGSHFENLNLTRQLFPNKLLIHTEGCTGYSKFKPRDELANAEMYASEIIGDLNHGANGFVDWNLVLDYQGGPNHKHNYCNSPIMLNKKHSDFIKTPSFYYIAHFSKYIQPNAKRIHISTFSENILATAFENPDKSVVVVLCNPHDFNIEYNLCLGNQFFHDNLDSHAIVTLVGAP